MDYIHLSDIHFHKLKIGQIKIWCNTCHNSTWHYKNSKTRYRKGYSPSIKSYWVCEICETKNPMFQNNDYNNHIKKTVTCPKCKELNSYRTTFCEKCGFRLIAYENGKRKLGYENSKRKEPLTVGRGF